MNVSICMAAYNGSLFIRRQIESILEQMNVDDELIVVDDSSKDNTLSIVLSFHDSRIRVECNKLNLGHVQSFSKSIALAKNTYIVFADQDDVWVQGRLDRIKNSMMQTGVGLVTGNSKFINAMDAEIAPPYYSYIAPENSQRHAYNIFGIFIGKSPYYGCNMAINRKLLPIIMPIPSYVQCHDIWIAMAANLMRTNLHLEDVLICRRIHGDNFTNPNRPLFSKLKSRFIFSASLVHLMLRKLRSLLG